MNHPLPVARMQRLGCMRMRGIFSALAWSPILHPVHPRHHAARDDDRSRARSPDRQHIMWQLRLNRPHSDRKRRVLGGRHPLAGGTAALLRARVPHCRGRCDSLRPAFARLRGSGIPPGFVFNIKAFGLLTQHPIDPRRLPEGARAAAEEGTADGRALL
jgi:hypothetical protein